MHNHESFAHFICPWHPKCVGSHQAVDSEPTPLESHHRRVLRRLRLSATKVSLSSAYVIASLWVLLKFLQKVGSLAHWEVVADLWSWLIPLLTGIPQVMCLMNGYSIVKDQWEILSSHLIGQKSAKSQPCCEKKLKIFFWTQIFECINKAFVNSLLCRTIDYCNLLECFLFIEIESKSALLYFSQFSDVFPHHF